jgi:hypothetical protein
MDELGKGSRLGATVELGGLGLGESAAPDGAGAVVEG